TVGLSSHPQSPLDFFTSVNSIDFIHHPFFNLKFRNASGLPRPPAGTLLQSARKITPELLCPASPPAQPPPAQLDWHTLQGVKPSMLLENRAPAIFAFW